MDDLSLALALLTSQTPASLAVMFWYTLVFEIPRYGLPLLVALAPLLRAGRVCAPPCPPPLRDWGSRGHAVSIIVVGHNEAEALDRCIRSLREQSRDPAEVIIVSDGSSDAMADVAARLVREGLADEALSPDLRGGKSSALNLAIGAANGDIIVAVDCDCSYDRFAIESIIAPFKDPSVGAVCGDILPRNGDASLLSRFQEIEYLLTISAGKRMGSLFDQVVCLSGAFSAFRRQALREIGGFDVGGGEDFDVTLRLRARGWRIAFAPNALCYTDVPVSLRALIRQRLRWERDSVRLRYRKFRDLMIPGRSRFALAEALHQWDFLLFSVAGAITFPLYLAWLWTTYGSFAVPILVAAQLGLLLPDAAVLALSARAAGRPAFARNIAYLPGYAVFASFVMRLVRAWAYASEWMLFSSRRDDFVPAKVRLLRKW